MTDVRITLWLDGHPRDVTLAYPLPDEHGELLGDLYRQGELKGVIECRMHDDDPNLRDLRDGAGRIPGIWLYLRKINGQLFLCHWPDGLAKGSHRVPSPMTPEHRARQEYIARRGVDAGYHAVTEETYAKGTRSDVVITGAVTMCAEVQEGRHIPMGTVLKRTRLAHQAGATSAWFADHKNPRWAFRVPHVETNARLGMDPRTWTVSTGPRKLTRELCSPSSPMPRCPEGRSGWCGRWHELWVPMPGLTVDDVIEQAPAGELVSLDTGTKQGMILARKADAAEWREAHPVVAVPQQRRTETAKPRATPRHASYSAEKIRRRVGAPPSPPAVPHVAPKPVMCTDCGLKMAPVGFATCTRCFFFPGRFRPAVG